MTYLELCQTVRQEVGLSGTGPTTVTSQEGQLKVVVDLVIESDAQIQTLWHDWNFLWSQYTSSVTVGNRAPALQKPTDLGMWDRDSFFLDYTTNDSTHLRNLPYHDYREDQRQGVATNATPTYVIIQPDQNIILDPPADTTYSITADYWKTPTRLSANTDVSAIPSQFHRIIIARAKTMWAEREEAPEILLSSAAEYQDVLDKMESHSLPFQTPRRLSRDPEDIRVIPQ